MSKEYLHPATFEKAVPVWEKGKETEMNYILLFRAVVGAGDCTARLAAQTRFMLQINGVFVAAGPARAGHGFYRVDEYDLTPYLTQPRNVVSILVAGYNANSFSYLDLPSFLCCELTDGNKVLAATGSDGFSAFHDTRRLQKVQRYSFQRPFVESYVLDKNDSLLEADPDYSGHSVTLVPVSSKRFLRRGVPYSEYELAAAEAGIERGHVTVQTPEKLFDDRAISETGPTLKGFPKSDLEALTVCDAQKYRLDHADTTRRKTIACTIPASGYEIFKLPKDLTGFIEAEVFAEQDTTVYLTFDEVFNRNTIDFTRMACSNVLVWKLTGGAHYLLRSFEPYTMQYLCLISTNGALQVNSLQMRRYDFPASLITQAVAMPTARLQKIYDAAEESFRQNTLDIYMDCPSRERAGWLCDSFFTSRVEYALTGHSTVEHNFLENFLMPEHFACLPKGMLPMCYPSDHYDGVYIPNWAMWFVLELKEYLQRSGDRALVDAARERIYALLDFFKGYENADGLLEKLDSWVFVEWSHSNDLVQDINYPTNMLYARVKETVAELYGDEALRRAAATLKDTIRAQAWTGSFFCDNAVYGDDGVAALSGECTESCQYYAFFTGTATPESHPALWKTMVEDFGPERKKHNTHPDIAFANAFIGNYLRLELLFRAGEYDRVLQNIDGYFTYMAEKTGTLWEHDGDYASCDHGFASHVIYWLNTIIKKA